MGVCGENPSGPDQEASTSSVSNRNKPLSSISSAPPPKKLKVYGHAFNSDTRTILTLLDISKIEYDYEEIDIFMGKHQEEKYLKINPTGSIPVVIDDDCQLMGSPSIFANYLTSKFKKLHSYMPPEHKAKIDQHMNWFLT